jgi:hypothetical protein
MEQSFHDSTACPALITARSKRPATPDTGDDTRTDSAFAYVPSQRPSTSRVGCVPAAPPACTAVSRPSAETAEAVEVPATWTELEGPVVFEAIFVAPPTFVTVHPATDASTFVFTSATVTASMSTTSPVPLIAPVVYASFPPAFALPPVTLIDAPVPFHVDVIATPEPDTDATARTLGFKLASFAFITAATSAAVAAPMAAKLAVLKTKITAVPLIVTCSSSASTRAKGPFALVRDAAVAANVATEAPAPSILMSRCAPAVSLKGPTIDPRMKPAAAATRAVDREIDAGALVRVDGSPGLVQCTTREV